jgi:hypothetical protein
METESERQNCRTQDEICMKRWPGQVSEPRWLGTPLPPGVGEFSAKGTELKKMHN